jgi:hypothetical protein
MVSDVLGLTIDLLESLELDDELAVGDRIEKDQVHHISLQLMNYNDRDSITDWLDEIALKLDGLCDNCPKCRRRLKHQAQSIRIIASSIQSSEMSHGHYPR